MSNFQFFLYALGTTVIIGIFIAWMLVKHGSQ